MAKFIKRLKKSIGTVENALVIGEAFGYLEQLPDHFNSVFTHNQRTDLKYRNLIYIKSIEDIEISNSIHVVLLDLHYLSYIEKIKSILVRQKPYIAIEGNDVVERPNVEYLYQIGYRAIERQGMFHLWKKIK